MRTETAVCSVERRHGKGAWVVAGTRVGLGVIVQQFWEGQSPEAIHREFPTLSLEQVYGAIAFYLANRVQVDADLEREAMQYERLRRKARIENADLHTRLAEVEGQRR